MQDWFEKIRSAIFPLLPVDCRARHRLVSWSLYAADLYHQSQSTLQICESQIPDENSVLEIFSELSCTRHFLAGWSFVEHIAL